MVEYSISLRLSLESPKEANTVVTSTGQELRQIPEKRSKTRLERKGKDLLLSIEARDMGALKASFSSAMKAIALSHRVLKGFSGANR